MFYQNFNGHFVYKTDCLTRWPDRKDHFELVLMRFFRFPKNFLNFRNFENCHIFSMETSRPSVLAKYLLSETSIFLKMLQKNGKILRIDGWIIWPLNYVCIVVMCIGKYQLPLTVLSSVCLTLLFYWGKKTERNKWLLRSCV